MFPGEIAIVPWSLLEALISALSEGGTARRATAICTLDVMVRIYSCNNGTSPTLAEEALYDIQSIRAFVGLDLGRNMISNETTVAISATCSNVSDT